MAGPQQVFLPAADGSRAFQPRAAEGDGVRVVLLGRSMMGGGGGDTELLQLAQRLSDEARERALAEQRDEWEVSVEGSLSARDSTTIPRRKKPHPPGGSAAAAKPLTARSPRRQTPSMGSVSAKLQAELSLFDAKGEDASSTTMMTKSGMAVGERYWTVGPALEHAVDRLPPYRSVGGSLDRDRAFSPNPGISTGVRVEAWIATVLARADLDVIPEAVQELRELHTTGRRAKQPALDLPAYMVDSTHSVVAEDSLDDRWILMGASSPEAPAVEEASMTTSWLVASANLADPSIVDLTSQPRVASQAEASMMEDSMVESADGPIAAHHSTAVARRPPGANKASCPASSLPGSTLSKVGLDRGTLEALGLDRQAIDETYRALYVHSAGACGFVRQACKKCTVPEKRAALGAALWLVYLQLVEGAEDAQYNTVVKRIRDAAQEETRRCAAVVRETDARMAANDLLRLAAQTATDACAADSVALKALATGAERVAMDQYARVMELEDVVKEKDVAIKLGEWRLEDLGKKVKEAAVKQKEVNEAYAQAEAWEAKYKAVCATLDATVEARAREAASAEARLNDVAKAQALELEKRADAHKDQRLQIERLHRRLEVAETDLAKAQREHSHDVRKYQAQVEAVAQAHTGKAAHLVRLASLERDDDVLRHERVQIGLDRDLRAAKQTIDGLLAAQAADACLLAEARTAFPVHQVRAKKPLLRHATQTSASRVVIADNNNNINININITPNDDGGTLTPPKSSSGNKPIVEAPTAAVKEAPEDHIPPIVEAARPAMPSPVVTTTTTTAEAPRVVATSLEVEEETPALPSSSSSSSSSSLETAVGPAVVPPQQPAVEEDFWAPMEVEENAPAAMTQRTTTEDGPGPMTVSKLLSGRVLREAVRDSLAAAPPLEQKEEDVARGAPVVSGRRRCASADGAMRPAAASSRVTDAAPVPAYREFQELFAQHRRREAAILSVQGQKVAADEAAGRRQSSSSLSLSVPLEEEEEKEEKKKKKTVDEDAGRRLSLSSFSSMMLPLEDDDVEKRAIDEDAGRQSSSVVVDARFLPESVTRETAAALVSGMWIAAAENLGRELRSVGSAVVAAEALWQGKHRDACAAGAATFGALERAACLKATEDRARAVAAEGEVRRLSAQVEAMDVAAGAAEAAALRAEVLKLENRVISAQRTAIKLGIELELAKEMGTIARGHEMVAQTELQRYSRDLGAARDALDVVRGRYEAEVGQHAVKATVALAEARQVAAANENLLRRVAAHEARDARAQAAADRCSQLMGDTMLTVRSVVDAFARRHQSDAEDTRRRFTTLTPAVLGKAAKRYYARDDKDDHGGGGDDDDGAPPSSWEDDDPRFGLHVLADGAFAPWPADEVGPVDGLTAAVDKDVLRAPLDLDLNAAAWQTAWRTFDDGARVDGAHVRSRREALHKAHGLVVEEDDESRRRLASGHRLSSSSSSEPGFSEPKTVSSSLLLSTARHGHLVAGRQAPRSSSSSSSSRAIEEERSPEEEGVMMMMMTTTTTGEAMADAAVAAFDIMAPASCRREEEKDSAAGLPPPSPSSVFLSAGPRLQRRALDPDEVTTTALACGAVLVAEAERAATALERRHAGQTDAALGCAAAATVAAVGRWFGLAQRELQAACELRDYQSRQVREHRRQYAAVLRRCEGLVVAGKKAQAHFKKELAARDAAKKTLVINARRLKVASEGKMRQLAEAERQAREAVKQEQLNSRHVREQAHMGLADAEARELRRWELAYVVAVSYAVDDAFDTAHATQRAVDPVDPDAMGARGGGGDESDDDDDDENNDDDSEFDYDDDDQASMSSKSSQPNNNKKRPAQRKRAGSKTRLSVDDEDDFGQRGGKRFAARSRSSMRASNRAALGAQPPPRRTSRVIRPMNNNNSNNNNSPRTPTPRGQRDGFDRQGGTTNHSKSPNTTSSASLYSRITATTKNATSRGSLPTASHGRLPTASHGRLPTASQGTLPLAMAASQATIPTVITSSFQALPPLSVSEAEPPLATSDTDVAAAPAAAASPPPGPKNPGPPRRFSGVVPNNKSNAAGEKKHDKPNSDDDDDDEDEDDDDDRDINTTTTTPPAKNQADEAKRRAAAARAHAALSGGGGAGPRASARVDKARSRKSKRGPRRKEPPEMERKAGKEATSRWLKMRDKSKLSFLWLSPQQQTLTTLKDQFGKMSTSFDTLRTRYLAGHLRAQKMSGVLDRMTKAFEEVKRELERQQDVNKELLVAKKQQQTLASNDKNADRAASLQGEEGGSTAKMRSQYIGDDEGTQSEQVQLTMRQAQTDLTWVHGRLQAATALAKPRRPTTEEHLWTEAVDYVSLPTGKLERLRDFQANIDHFSEHDRAYEPNVLVPRPRPAMMAALAGGAPLTLQQMQQLHQYQQQLFQQQQRGGSRTGDLPEVQRFDSFTHFGAPQPPAGARASAASGYYRRTPVNFDAFGHTPNPANKRRGRNTLTQEGIAENETRPTDSENKPRAADHLLSMLGDEDKKNTSPPGMDEAKDDDDVKRRARASKNLVHSTLGSALDMLSDGGLANDVEDIIKGAAGSPFFSGATPGGGASSMADLFTAAKKAEKAESLGGGGGGGSGDSEAAAAASSMEEAADAAKEEKKGKEGTAPHSGEGGLSSSPPDGVAEPRSRVLGRELGGSSAAIVEGTKKEPQAEQGDLEAARLPVAVRSGLIPQQQAAAKKEVPVEVLNAIATLEAYKQEISDRLAEEAKAASRPWPRVCEAAAERRLKARIVMSVMSCEGKRAVFMDFEDLGSENLPDEVVEAAMGALERGDRDVFEAMSGFLSAKSEVALGPRTAEAIGYALDAEAEEDGTLARRMLLERLAEIQEANIKASAVLATRKLRYWSVKENPSRAMGDNDDDDDDDDDDTDEAEETADGEKKKNNKAKMKVSVPEAITPELVASLRLDEDPLVFCRRWCASSPTVSDRSLDVTHLERAIDAATDEHGAPEERNRFKASVFRSLARAIEAFHGLKRVYYRSRAAALATRLETAKNDAAAAAADAPTEPYSAHHRTGHHHHHHHQKKKKQQQHTSAIGTYIGNEAEKERDELAQLARSHDQLEGRDPLDQASHCSSSQQQQQPRDVHFRISADESSVASSRPVTVGASLFSASVASSNGENDDARTVRTSATAGS